MRFDEMNAMQRRLHNACIVLEAEGDEHGFTGMLLEAIGEISRMETALNVAMIQLETIGRTPRGKGAKRNAFATWMFLRTQLETPNVRVQGCEPASPAKRPLERLVGPLRPGEERT